jgi:Tol biopolymer transport system component
VAARANDPAETQIRYDLYRIPFNDGQGGEPEAIAGASGNGLSNSFPKVSPDGRWIVYVQSRNGQLMRPDSQLYIVPAAGGAAQHMRCSMPLMNSWHSFSPNGRWLVFSSKSRSPYTQMFLTHIDANGNDSPAILIENATAANRATTRPLPATELPKLR